MPDANRSLKRDIDNIYILLLKYVNVSVCVYTYIFIDKSFFL